MFHRRMILVYWTFGFSACLFESINGNYNCEDTDISTSTSNFIKEACPLFGNLQCLATFFECVAKNGVNNIEAIIACSSYFPRTNITDPLTLLCHVCEDQSVTSDGFDILCCIKTETIKRSGKSLEELNELDSKCIGTLDATTCQAGEERKEICSNL